MLDLKEIRARGGRVPIGAKDRKGNEIHLGDTIRFMDAREWGSEDLPQGVVHLKKGEVRQPGGSAGDLDQYFEIIRKGDPDPDVAALLSELDRLTTALAAAQAERDSLNAGKARLAEILGFEADSEEANRWKWLNLEVSRIKAERDRLRGLVEIQRARAQHAEAILSGILPGPLSDALLDARNHESRTEGVSGPHDWGWLVGRAQVEAARRGPVVEWYPTTVGEAARLGMFWLSVGPGGWTLRIRLPFGLGIGDLVESGPETGPDGKDKAEAAYRKAAGLA